MNHKIEIHLNRLTFVKQTTDVINGEREDGIFIPFKYNPIAKLDKCIILNFTAAELRRKKSKKKYNCTHIFLPLDSKTQRFYRERLGINMGICGYMRETWADRMAREEAEGTAHDDEEENEENHSISEEKANVLNILDDEEDYSISYPYEFKMLERVIERYPYDDDDTIPDGEEENTKEFLKTFLYKIKTGQL